MSTVDLDTVPRPAPATVDRVAVRRSSSAVMAMSLFVTSEAIFFAAFLGVYASAFTESDVWPPDAVPLPALLQPTIAVAVLLVSAITFGVALRQMRRSEQSGGLVGWLSATLVCAIAFVVLVLAGMPGLGYGIGQGIYESLFYMITALALAHVAGGVVLFLLILSRVRSGNLQLVREPMLAAGIYWYFVVAVGTVIYFLLYVVVAA